MRLDTTRTDTKKEKRTQKSKIPLSHGTLDLRDYSESFQYIKTK